MKTLMIILFSILSIENWAAEKKELKFSPPPYTVTITENNVTDCITIKLTPGRYLGGGEKIKVFIADVCGNRVFSGEYRSGVDYFQHSTITICKSEFDLSNFCWVYNNGDMDFIVDVYYDLNDGNPHRNKTVRI